MTKYKQKQTKRKRQLQKKNHISVSFSCALFDLIEPLVSQLVAGRLYVPAFFRPAGSVNCARADRVTSDRYRGPFPFL